MAIATGSRTTDSVFSVGVDERNHLVRHAVSAMEVAVHELSYVIGYRNERGGEARDAASRISALSCLLDELGWQLVPEPGREVWEVPAAELRAWLPSFLRYDEKCLEDDEQELARLGRADDGRLAKGRKDVAMSGAFLDRVADTSNTNESAGAQHIANALRDGASLMPLDSDLRALALRSATRWQRVVDQSDEPALSAGGEA